jgi:hypothetical protein
MPNGTKTQGHTETADDRRAFCAEKFKWLNALNADKDVDGRPFKVAFAISQYFDVETGETCRLSDITIAAKTGRALCAPGAHHPPGSRLALVATHKGRQLLLSGTWGSSTGRAESSTSACAPRYVTSGANQNFNHPPRYAARGRSRYAASGANLFIESIGKEHW